MISPCSYYIERRRFRPAPPPAFHQPQLSPRLLRLIQAEPLASAAVLDLGCGSGRLALALAPHAAWVCGADWSEAAVLAARRQAAEAGLTNCEFRVADVEAIDYDALLPPPGAFSRWDLIVAHLCMADAMIEHAAKALAAGQCLCFVAFHRDQWLETGRRSRFAYDEEQLAQVLRAAGFRIEFLGVEQEIVSFESAEIAFKHYFTAGDLVHRWREDGRLEGLRSYFAAGGRTFTAKSHVIVKARRQA